MASISLMIMPGLGLSTRPSQLALILPCTSTGTTTRPTKVPKIAKMQRVRKTIKNINRTRKTSSLQPKSRQSSVVTTTRETSTVPSLSLSPKPSLAPVLNAIVASFAFSIQRRLSKTSNQQKSTKHSSASSGNKPGSSRTQDTGTTLGFKTKLNKNTPRKPEFQVLR